MYVMGCTTFLSMEARDNEPKIRPIPIEDRDGMLLPDAGGPRRSRGKRPQRPWLPLAVSGLAVGTLLGAVTFFGAVEFDDPPSTDPETFSLTTIVEGSAQPTDVLPPTLAKMIPGVTERLTLVTTDGDAIWTYVWDPTFRVPNEFSMKSPQTPDWLSASFEVGGRYIAVAGIDGSAEQHPDIWIGQPTEIEPTPDLEDVLSYTWHASEVSRLAYLTGGEDGFLLETVQVDILSKTPSDPIAALAFTELSDLIRWDNKGFIVQIGDEVAALDNSGAERWRIDGWAHSASPNHIAQVRQTGSGPQWYLVERSSGESVSFAGFGVDVASDVTNVVASPNSDIFAVVTNRVSRTTITVVGPSQNAPRIVQVEGLLYPLQFTSDSNFLILTSATSNDLTFVDWRSGARHILDVPDGRTVLAMNLG
jgi:hypothetical protein